jgi:hypothetical protein
MRPLRGNLAFTAFCILHFYLIPTGFKKWWGISFFYKYAIPPGLGTCKSLVYLIEQLIHKNAIIIIDSLIFRIATTLW